MYFEWREGYKVKGWVMLAMQGRGRGKCCVGLGGDGKINQIDVGKEGAGMFWVCSWGLWALPGPG